MSAVYLLTGVSRGLGRALLAECISHGIYVVGCSRSKAAVDALNTEYQNQGTFSVVDVADAAAVDAWAVEIINAGITPTVLINNAGVVNNNATLWEISDKEFTHVFDVNVRGIANIIRSFMPHLLKLGSGTIVNLSSGWGRSTSPEVAPYCASKWAVEGLSQALAQELPAGFCCVALNPGIIDTDMLRTSFGAAAGSYQKPSKWAGAAFSLIQSLTPRHTGRAMSV